MAALDHRKLTAANSRDVGNLAVCPAVLDYLLFSTYDAIVMNCAQRLAPVPASAVTR